MSGNSESALDHLQSTPKNIDDYILEFDYEWRQGSRDRAVQVARAYIEARRSQLQPILGLYTLEQLVKEIDLLRNEGAKREHDRIIVDMWLLSEFEPQSISCFGTPTVKLVQVFGGVENGRV